MAYTPSTSTAPVLAPGPADRYPQPPYDYTRPGQVIPGPPEFTLLATPDGTLILGDVDTFIIVAAAEEDDSFLLLEGTDYLLLEGSDRLILEEGSGGGGDDITLPVQYRPGLVTYVT